MACAGGALVVVGVSGEVRWAGGGGKWLAVVRLAAGRGRWLLVVVRGVVARGGWRLLGSGRKVGFTPLSLALLRRSWLSVCCVRCFV